jgi:hypothetical protein
MATSKNKTRKPLVKAKPGARRADGSRLHPCGIDVEAINETVCQLEQMAPRLETSTVAVFQFTSCLAKRCKAAKIPVTAWLEEPIVDGIQLGFDHKLHQGNIPVVQDCEGHEVPRRHDSGIKRCYSYSLPLHHASPEIQLAAMPHLNALFDVVLEKAEAIASALDEARSFNCMGQCCPFLSGSRCCP